MVDIVEITQPADLAAYRLAWNALWMQSRRRCFTGSFDWFTAYWRASGGDRQLKVLLIVADRQPIGLLPLACSWKRTLWGDRRVLANAVQASSVLGCAIGPNPTATYLAALRYLAGHREEWDLLEIDHFEHSGELSRCRTAMQWTAIYRHTTSIGSYAMLDLTTPNRPTSRLPTAEALPAAASQQIEVRHYTPGGAAVGEGVPDWSLLEACVDIDASWLAPDQAGEGQGFLADGQREFHLETFAAAVKHGTLDLSVLHVDGRPAAYWYGYRTDDSLLCLALRRRAGATWSGYEQLLAAKHLTASAEHGARQCRLPTSTAASLVGCQVDLHSSYRLTAASGSLPRQIARNWRDRYRRRGISKIG
jgi:hypothetical protein